MKLSYVKLLSALLFLLIVCFLMCERAEGRRSGGSRSASRSSSRSSSSSSRSSSSSSRSSRSRSRSVTRKITRKIKKGAKKVYKKLKKLPKTKVKLPKVSPINRRLSTPERFVAWTAVGWLAGQRLRRTSYFVRFPCRHRFTECREEIFKHNSTSDMGYCEFMDHSRECITSAVSYGSPRCSTREHGWLRVAACKKYDNSSSIISWSNSSWPANEPLKLSFDGMSEGCRKQFEHCRQLAESEDDGSFCSMIQDRRECIEHKGLCSSELYERILDAACQRTAVNWVDGSPVAPDALRLSTAVVSFECQEAFEKCRLYTANHEGSINYCSMVDKRHKCLVGTGSCTAEDWQSFYDAACDGAVKLFVSLPSAVMLLVVSFLVK